MLSVTASAASSIVLPSLLTHDQAAACAQMLSASMRADVGDKLTVDASALDRFDSSALAVLLQCRREAIALGKNVTIVGLPVKLHELAVLYGIQSLLEP
jgi:phospholipid transport system transporter-binding protein